MPASGGHSQLGQLWPWDAAPAALAGLAARQAKACLDIALESSLQAWLQCPQHTFNQMVLSSRSPTRPSRPSQSCGVHCASKLESPGAALAKRVS